MSIPSPTADETSTPIPGYAFHESFEVADDVGEAYGIDIERNSRYSHGHGIVSDGLYEILLSGTIVCLNILISFSFFYNTLDRKS